MLKLKNKNLKFKIFLINLDKDIDRYKFTSSQLQSAGLAFERISGVDGRSYEWTRTEYDEDLSARKNGRGLTLGERGCALSHRNYYKKFVDEDLDYALILEDDVELPRNLSDILSSVINKNEANVKSKNKILSRPWEYLSFDYPEPGVFFIRHWLESLFAEYKNSIKDKNIFNKIHFIIIKFIKFIIIAGLSAYEGARNYLFKNIFKTGSPVMFMRPLYFASAYIITKGAASKLLDLSTPLVYPADRLPNVTRVEKGLIFRAYSPLVFKQRREDFGSSLLGVTGEHFKNK